MEKYLSDRCTIDGRIRIFLYKFDGRNPFPFLRKMVEGFLVIPVGIHWEISIKPPLKIIQIYLFIFSVPLIDIFLFVFDKTNGEFPMYSL